MDMKESTHDIKVDSIKSSASSSVNLGLFCLSETFILSYSKNNANSLHSIAAQFMWPGELKLQLHISDLLLFNFLKWIIIKQLNYTNHPKLSPKHDFCPSDECFQLVTEVQSASSGKLFHSHRWEFSINPWTLQSHRSSSTLQFARQFIHWWIGAKNVPALDNAVNITSNTLTFDWMLNFTLGPPSNGPLISNGSRLCSRLWFHNLLNPQL